MPGTGHDASDCRYGTGPNLLGRVWWKLLEVDIRVNAITIGGGQTALDHVLHKHAALGPRTIYGPASTLRDRRISSAGFLQTETGALRIT